MNFEGQSTIKPSDFVPGPGGTMQAFDPNARISVDPRSIPDLEKEDGAPNGIERMQIRNTADRMEIAETPDEKIARDVSAAQTKFKDVKMHPKDLLKSIIAKGDFSEVAHLFGANWTIRALDQGDMMMVFDEVKDTVTTVVGRLTALEFMKVVFSIEAINNIPIYDLFDEIKLSEFSNKMSYIIMVKKALQRYLEGFPPEFIDMLFVKYQEIEQKRSEALAELKNS